MSDTLVVLDEEISVVEVGNENVVVETSSEEVQIITAGEPGPPGPPGPPSTGQTLIYPQSIPSDLWVIVHNLNQYPSVTIVDSSGTQVFGTVHYISSNEIHVSFSAAFGGIAYLN